MKKILPLLLTSYLLHLTSFAQEQKGVTLSGSIQSDILIPQDDKAIGAKIDDIETGA